ncbi:MAG: isoprenylcysteine carboxylmethyltransferase family protein [Chloroflexota bacterium]|nr:MAG: isoprenylcysteine carboxylmethyltransferase family protein [Chloroflexota bacterium]
MDIELVSKVTLIVLFCLFSIIRIEYYRRARKVGYRTVIVESRWYSIWLSIFICYEVFTFFIYILYPDLLAWATIALPMLLRIAGAFLGFVALLWFIWIHRSLGSNLSVRLQIKDSQKLVTDGPYRWIRHPMYTAFYLLHLATFLLTANWFIGLSWMAGLTVTIALRIRKEEAMMVNHFGKQYRLYMQQTGRFLPVIRWRPSAKKRGAA